MVLILCEIDDFVAEPNGEGLVMSANSFKISANGSPVLKILMVIVLKDGDEVSFEAAPVALSIRRLRRRSISRS